MKEFQFVVLFDIDGTLLGGPPTGPSAGMRAMNRAVEMETGRVGRYNSVEFAGRTDLQIARDLLCAALGEPPAPRRLERAIEVYLDHLAQYIQSAPYTVLGDPVACLGALAKIGAVVGLGTGNVRAGSAIKLASAGIGHLFDLDRGGYGDDGHSRGELLAVGARRCDPSGRLPVVVVGDTPYDVAAARDIGAKCIGVPFGSNTAAVLRTAGADQIVEKIDGELGAVALTILAGH